MKRLSSPLSDSSFYGTDPKVLTRITVDIGTVTRDNINSTSVFVRYRPKDLVTGAELLDPCSEGMAVCSQFYPVALSNSSQT